MIYGITGCDSGGMLPGGRGGGGGQKRGLFGGVFWGGSGFLINTFIGANAQVVRANGVFFGSFLGFFGLFGDPPKTPFFGHFWPFFGFPGPGEHKFGFGFGGT